MSTLSGNTEITGDLIKAVLLRKKKENLKRVGWREHGKQRSEDTEYVQLLWILLQTGTEER